MNLHTGETTLTVILRTELISLWRHHSTTTSIHSSKHAEGPSRTEACPSMHCSEGDVYTVYILNRSIRLGSRNKQEEVKNHPSANT